MWTGRPLGLLGSVPLGPQLGYSVVFLAVLRVLSRDAADEGVGGIAVRKQGADREQDLKGKSRVTFFQFG